MALESNFVHIVKQLKPLTELQDFQTFCIVDGCFQIETRVFSGWWRGYRARFAIIDQIRLYVNQIRDLVNAYGYSKLWHPKSTPSNDLSVKMFDQMTTLSSSIPQWLQGIVRLSQFERYQRDGEFQRMIQVLISDLTQLVEKVDKMLIKYRNQEKNVLFRHSWTQEPIETTTE